MKKRIKDTAKRHFISYVDGACTKLGVGGSGGFLCSEGTITNVFYLDQNNTTNNQMELTGAILALLAFSEISKKGDSIVINSDSQYVVKGINEWIYGWIKKGWKSTSGPVLNMDLWKLFHYLVEEIRLTNDVEFRWVRGHNGNPGR